MNPRSSALRTAALTLVLCAFAWACNRGAVSAPPAPPPPYVRPPIIDYHAHLSLDGLDRIARIMTENGIETFVNLSGGSLRHGDVEWAAALELSKKLGGRVINFENPDWHGFGEPDWAEREAARLEVSVEQYGFRGLKISKGLGLGVTDQQDRLIGADDARLGPLWKKAADLGLPVSIHVADPRAFWLPLTPQNERWDELHAHPYWAYGPIPPELAGDMPPRPPVPSWQEMLQAAERLYRQNPRTTFVAVHFGNAAEDVDYVAGLLDRNPNVWIDIAARVGEFGRHPAEKIRAFFEKYQDRIVFGTDIGVGADYLMLGSNGEIEPTMKDVAPFYAAHARYLETRDRAIAHPSPIQGNWKVDAIGLAPGVLNKIYRANALRVLDRAALMAFAAKAPAPPSGPIVVPAPAGAPPAAPVAAPSPALKP